jgi:type VI secretion system secreted protein Hcp
MATDMFLKLDGVTGESKDKVHPKEIDVLAWSWAMSNCGSAHVGGGAGSGKADVHDLSFTKYVDSSSPKLMLNCCSGTHLAKGLLTVRKAGGNPLEYVKIKMETIYITNVATNGSGAEDRLTENVTLNFAKVSVDYTPQKADGSADTAIPFGWDIAANCKA